MVLPVEGDDRHGKERHLKEGKCVEFKNVQGSGCSNRVKRLLLFPIDAGGRALVHGLFDFFLRGASWVVYHRFVISMAVIMVMIPFHFENFRADLGADFTGDTGFLVDNGDPGHVLIDSFHRVCIPAIVSGSSTICLLKPG